MDVLIIGGTRFLGLKLTEKLLQQDHTITLFNRGMRRNQFPYANDVEWLIGDRHDEQKFRALFTARKFDVVIDTCAYFLSDAKLIVDVFRDKIGKYIFTSSMAVAHTTEFVEQLPLPIPNRRLFDTSPKNSYAYNKTQIEKFLIEQYDQHGFPFISLRPSEINGPGEIREWYYIERIKKGRRQILIPNSGENLFQPGYVDDIIQGFLLAIDKDEAIGECYNLAGEEIVSLNQYIKLLADELKAQIKIVNIPYQLFRQVVQKKYFFPFCYKYSFVVDLTKTKKELGYQPQISVSAGIHKSLEQWPESYVKKSSPYNVSGEFELMSYEVEDLLISTWENEMNETTERVREKMRTQGMLF